MNHRILVVEDNALNLELMMDWLESEGFGAQSATTLDEAFAALRGEAPDLVLLDVQLGTQDGLALLAWLRDNPQLRNLPVIAVTAHAMLTDYERVMRAGCCACVSKPIDFRLLHEHLERWLGKPADAPSGKSDL
jgi:two-component system, cell cycle response regulator DivK